MKVVLFCGGYGTRLQEFSQTTPKSLIQIGNRPIIWHLMRYYAHFGHKEFVLCLGYKGDMIKDYFLNYNECVSNDFVFRRSGREIELHNSDIEDWEVTFVDTGMHSTVGQRLIAVAPYLQREKIFLANYSDGLSDLPLPEQIEFFNRSGAIACVAGVRPHHSLSHMHLDDDGLVTHIEYMNQSQLLINGGFMVLRNEIFEHIQPGDELVEAPFRRIIERRKLVAFRYEGFWAALDTYKDKKMFDDMYNQGDRPWEVWKN